MPLWFSNCRSARLVRLGCLSLCLLALAIGCSQKKETDMADVSGKVLFRGEPLPGGRVSFVSKDGPAFSSGGLIDENGNYKAQAPIGDVKAGVDNDFLKTFGGRKGQGAPAVKPGLKRPGSEEAQGPKGHYVPIPEKYRSPDESGLTYKIQEGSNTIDIKLD